MDGTTTPDPAGVHVADVTAEIAHSVYDALLEDGDSPWAELTDDERSMLEMNASLYIMAHITAMGMRGLRLIPAGAVPRPHSEQEALAMIQAAKDWFDAQKRKGKLMTGATGGKKLILPGMH